MVKDMKSTRTEICTLVNLRTVKLMERVSTLGSTERFMMVSGRMDSNMEMECGKAQMEIHT